MKIRVHHEKVQHEKSDNSEIWKEKCSRVHKWITGRPLMDHYTLVLLRP